MTTIATLQSLLTGPTTGDEGRAFIRDLVATAPTPISITVLDTPGTPEGAIVWALGDAEALRSSDRLEFAKSGFRSTCSRDWLGVNAEEIYGVVPREEDFATSNVTVTNSSGALYGPFPPASMRFVNDTTNVVYANIEEVTLPIGPSTTTVGIVAIEAGSGSDAQVGEVNRLETPLEGVTVTNPQPALGKDAESADSLNRRIDSRIGVFGVDGATGFATGGSASAYESIARNGVDNGGGVPREDGTRVTVTRTQLVRDDATGVSTLYLADDDGPLAIGDVAIVEAPIQAYAEWISSEIEVENTTAVAVTVSGTLTITDVGADDATILARIDDELTAASRKSKLSGFGGSVSLRYVENAVEAAGDEGKPTAFTLVDIALSSPSGPTALDDGEVLVLSRGTITIVRE
jgi:hypothetical protein